MFSCFTTKMFPIINNQIFGHKNIEHCRKNSTCRHPQQATKIIYIAVEPNLQLLWLVCSLFIHYLFTFASPPVTNCQFYCFKNAIPPTLSFHFPYINIYMLVEEGATRGTTALVYYQLHNSLYTGIVQG